MLLPPHKCSGFAQLKFIMKKNNVQKNGLQILFGEILVNLGVAAGMYLNYLMTDLAHISVNVTSVIMTLGSVVSFIFIFYSGALITNCKSKMGKYRPFILWPYLIVFLAILAFTFLSGNTMLTIAIAGVCYAVYSVCMNMPATGKYGLYALIAGDDENARNIYNSRSYAGFNASTAISSLLLLPMVFFFADLTGGEEINGWRITHVILAVLALLGIFILMRLGKPYDLPSDGVGEEEEKISFSSMVKAVVKNRPALTVTLYDVFRYTALMLNTYLIVYYCNSVIGNFQLMTILMAGASVVGVAACLVAPLIVNIFGGKKRMCITVSTLTGILWLIVFLFGRNSKSLAILYLIVYFVATFVDAVCIGLYIDAGEYWLAEKHEDTRPFIMMMQNVASACGMVVAPILMGIALNMSHYTENAVLVGKDGTMMGFWMAAVPGILNILAAIVLLFHNKSDAEMKEYLKQNVDAGLSIEME